jgi:RNA polymerase sigma factor (sigma-70 family)
MAHATLTRVLQDVQRLAASQRCQGLGDGELLDVFLVRNDQAAFAALVERYGVMVLRVCRSMLPCPEDAEDAFQATFLVLARKASAIRKKESLAAWLHGVARRIALSARRTAARRRSHEAAREPRPEPGPSWEVAWREVQAILDEEIQRLPEKYRLPFLLCCLEGWSRAEAARRLGWKEGTLSSRLDRARKQLQARLARRGIALSAALGAAALLPKAAVAAVPASLLRAAQQIAALPTGAPASSAVPGKVVALADGLSKGVLGANLKLLAVALVGLGLLAGLGTLVGGPTAPPAQTHQRAAKPPSADHAGPAEQPRTDVHGDPLPPGALARMGTVRFRHGATVARVAFSADGQLASAAHDNSIRSWDAATGRERRRMHPAQGEYADATQVNTIAFSPDGRYLASGTSTRTWTVRLWDAKTGKEVGRFQDLRFDVTSVLFSPDGRQLIAGGRDKKVCVWDLAGTRPALLFDGHVDEIQALALSPDGATLACCGNGISLVELATGKLLWQTGRHRRQLEGQDEKVTCATFSPDGKHLVSGDYKGALRVWDTATGQRLRNLGSEQVVLFAVAFTPDGRFLASAGLTEAIHLWDTATWKKVRSLRGHRGGTHAVAFARDGKTLASGGRDQVVRLWSVESGKELPVPRGHQNAISSLAYSADGQTLATASVDQSLRLWEAATGKETRRVGSAEPPQWIMGGFRFVRFTPDRRHLIAAADTIRGWDLRTNGELARLAPKSQPFGPVALSADGKTLAAMDDGNQIIVWDLPTANAKARLSLPRAKTHAAVLALSADGKHLAAATSGYVAPDGRHLGEVTVWDLADGQRARPLKASAEFIGVSALALSPDGRLLVAAVQGLRIGDQTRAWDVATGKELPAFVGPTGSVWSLAFSPDGKTLATGAGEGDGTIRLWELATRQIRLTLRGQQGTIHDLAFSPDGRRLASAGKDTTALVWDVTGGQATGRPSARDLDTLWADLAGDAARAYRAICGLGAAPEQAVPFVQKHLRPVVLVPPEHLARLVAALDSNRFPAREEAARELEQLGESAEPGLRGALGKQASLEVRQRIERLLERLEKTKLREGRALEAIERMPGREAKALLRSLAEGVPEAQLTREARAALRRLENEEEPGR